MQATGPRLGGRHITDLILTESIAGETGNLHLESGSSGFCGRSVYPVLRRYGEAGLDAMVLFVVVVACAGEALFDRANISQ